MSKSHLGIGLFAVGALALTGCELVEDVIGAVLDIENLAVLGVMPAQGFSDPSSPDHGKVTLAMGGEDRDGNPVRPGSDLIVIEDDKGEEIPVEGGEELPGFGQGSFALLVDGSGSLESSDPSCEGCPTDPTRARVEAAQTLTRSLAACGPDWRQALMEFTTEAADPEFKWTRTLAGFDSTADDVFNAAPALSSDGGTPLWDATSEVLASLVDDSVKQFASPPSKGEPEVDPNEYGVGLVVISDGADTGSNVSLDQLIAQALDAGVPIHVIGLGPASDAVEEFSAEPQAIADLRRLATETGGYYGYVADAEELPELTSQIANATCGGYTEVYARFDETGASGERKWGAVRLRNTPLSIPFTFTVP